MLASKGHRVLLADFDPQCNLTGMVMGFKGVDDLATIYDPSNANNVRDGLAPAFESQPRQIQPADCVEVSGVNGLYLLPGHIGLAEYETTLGIAQELSGSLLALRNLPGSLRYLLDVTASSINAEFVLIDMSPSLGPVNQNLLTTSDFFVVPLHPDYFSAMALSSLAKTLPRWQNWAKTAYAIEALTKADYPFPRPHTSFAGAVVQKYRPRNGGASKAFQKWIDELTDGLKATLVPELERAGMLDPVSFQEKLGQAPWVPVMEVADFNSLIAISQTHQVPVYAVTEGQSEQQGSVWRQTQASMKAFEQEFSRFADKLVEVTT